MHHKCSYLLIGLAAITVAQFFWCKEVPAAEAHNVVATFLFDEKTELRPTAFVLVNKRPVGAMQGTVVLTLPPQGKPVAVEIVIPRLGPNPVYSLVVGPKELEQKSADIVISHYTVSEVYSDDAVNKISPELILEPNTKQEIAIRKEANGIYKFVLPTQPYRNATEALWQLEMMKIQYSKVKSVNDNSDKNAIWHYSYSLRESKVVPLVLENADESSSSAPTLNKTGYGWGLPLSHEEWTVISEPTGATIITEMGAQGSTMRKIEMPVTGNPYPVHQMNGYADCSYEQCRTRKTAQGNVVTCNLTKLSQDASP